MKNIIERINSHIAFDDDLEKSEILMIIEKHEDLIYNGKAYRVLLFSNEPNISSLNIEQDASFSSSLKGIRQYMMAQDFDYYPYCVVFEVEMVGLDIIKSVYKFNELKSKREIAEREAEIVSGEIYSSIIK